MKMQEQKCKELACDAESIAEDFKRYLTQHLARNYTSDPYYHYRAISYAIRDRLVLNWHRTWERYSKPKVRKAYYMSLEFLIGRVLGNHLLNLDMEDETRKALARFSLELEDTKEQEPDAGLGNGGLGRLAACFMDSCAALSLPVVGYGIRYEYGMFNQEIANGYQIEHPDHWLTNDYPWEFVSTEYTQIVNFGGHTETYHDENGQELVRWLADEHVIALPYDVPVSGFKNNTVNTLRLWKATTTDEFDFNEFNAGSYSEAVAAKNKAEHISMVLYPNDASETGKELRLKQQYFLAAASLKDVCRIWEQTESDYKEFARYNIFQLNDTHPTIAIVELMRILLDEKHLPWTEAWQITKDSMAYTNHTLLPEALEKWPLSMFERLLPRLLEIIYRINAEFLQEVAMLWPGDAERLHRMSIIEEENGKNIRMAYLAIVGSHSVNGVAELHTKLLTENLFHDFYEMYPEKFNNKTNGVTPRRWLLYANPKLSGLITNTIGDAWTLNLNELAKLKEYANDHNHEFQAQWLEIKRQNKQRLANLVKEKCEIEFNPDSMFDVQVKRIHEYKRQVLNILHVIHLYNKIKSGKTKNWVNRNILIGGKAAPGYHLAKQIIKLANNVANVINTDSDVGERLKLAFLPNYSVSYMEIIAPGTDLSEQISTAGKEASGTGNMKFMLNGAVTIGTLDGANIEIRQEVGSDNFLLFGLTANEVEKLRSDYNPQSYIDNDADLFSVMHLMESGLFNTVEPGIFDDIIASLKNSHDPWMTLADFRSYVDAQEKASRLFADRQKWVRMSILNTAASGIFSTDRTINEYNEDIWKLEPLSN